VTESPLSVGDRVEEWVRDYPGFREGEYRRGTVLSVTRQEDDPVTIAGWCCVVEWDDKTWDENPSRVHHEDLRPLDAVERIAELGR
jgi:hypothetical protein